jgi:hypothetical protein
LNASSGLLHDGSFDVIFDNGSPVPFFSLSFEQSKYVPISTGSSNYSKSYGQLIFVLNGPPSPSIEIVLTSNQPSVIDISSLPSCLPRWDFKTLEFIGPDVGDIYSS